MLARCHPGETLDEKLMENRFGLKDLFTIVLLIAIIVSVWLAMVQRDQQYKVIQKLETEVKNQTTLINRISDQLQRGVPVGPSSTDTAQTQSNTSTALPQIVAARQKPDFAEGDIFVWPVPAPLKRLTPYVAGDVYQQWVENMVMESLATYDSETHEWIPVLAESWTISDDGMTFTFRIRPEARFSDGTPLTAHDVVFTYEWIMNPKVNAPRTRAYWERIQEVRAEGDYTVVFQMREPYFMGFVNCAIMNIMSRAYYGKFSPEEFNEMPGLLFGSGPWKLAGDPEDWKPGVGRTELVRNTNYWGPRPGLDGIIFREITDDTALATAFRNGEIDMFMAAPQQYLNMRDDPNILNKADLHVYDAINGGYMYVGWNQLRNGEPTLFADKRVRQALSHLVDLNFITDRILVGLARPATGPFHPLGDQDDPTLEPRKYDPDLARRLLTEAGFADRNGDGMIESADGRPFRFTLTYSTNNPVTQEIVFYLREAFARAGIVLEPDPLDWTILQQRLDDRNFDAVMLGWGAGWVESDVFQMFHSSQVADGGDNTVHYISEKFDQLVEKARRTTDNKERYALWNEVHRTLHDEQPYLFLFTRKSVVFVDKRFRNVRVLPTGIIGTIPEWYVPRDLQRRGR